MLNSFFFTIRNSFLNNSVLFKILFGVWQCNMVSLNDLHAEQRSCDAINAAGTTTVPIYTMGEL